MLSTPILELIVLTLSALSASSLPTAPSDTDLSSAHKAGSIKVIINIPSGGQVTTWSKKTIPWASFRDNQVKPQDIAGWFSPPLAGPTEYALNPFGIPEGEVNGTTVYNVDHTFGWNLQEDSNEFKGTVSTD